MWFHVDKVSSAHVYLRLAEGQSLDDVPMSVVEDAAQLVKANSIQGNKMNDVDVVYTMWANLHKSEAMDVGQVGFHKQKEVRKVRVAKRDNAIVNRLNKTKEEKQVICHKGRENETKCKISLFRLIFAMSVRRGIVVRGSTRRRSLNSWKRRGRRRSDGERRRRNRGEVKDYCNGLN